MSARRSMLFAAVGVALTACGGATGRSGRAPAKGSGNVATVELAKGGSFTFQLFPNEAPKTVENFEQKAAGAYFDGLVFHRVEDWVVQGGDPNTRGEPGRDFLLRPDPAKPGVKIAGTGGGTLPTELSQRPFAAGSVGVARGQDVRISNDSQFFICKRPADWLNGQYTNFGQVGEGMDVVAQIQVGDRIKRIVVR